ncbi:MAG: hypothetical protein LBQ78_01265 [Tannerellaceae bacterium]|jgi:hypothetical protein|nr:hypothetical protein [Tannerellaceae bacterium]
MESKHLLSETAEWTLSMEVTYPQKGVEVKSGGDSIRVFPDHIIRRTWFGEDHEKVDDEMVIRKTLPNSFHFVSNELPDFGTRYGTYHADRNHLYNRFKVENTGFNGFEISSRQGDVCHVEGAIYHHDVLVKTWTGVLKKR